MAPAVSLTRAVRRKREERVRCVSYFTLKEKKKNRAHSPREKKRKKGGGICGILLTSIAASNGGKKKGENKTEERPIRSIPFPID